MFNISRLFNSTLKSVQILAFSCKTDSLNPLEDFISKNAEKLDPDLSEHLRIWASIPKEYEVPITKETEFVFYDFGFPKDKHGNIETKPIPKEEIDKFMDKNNLSGISLEEACMALTQNEELFMNLPRSMGLLLYSKDQYAYKRDGENQFRRFYPWIRFKKIRGEITEYIVHPFGEVQAIKGIRSDLIYMFKKKS